MNLPNNYHRDFTGRVFGHLTAINYSHYKNKHSFWRCKCDCGKERIVINSDLTGGKITHCGCRNKRDPRGVDRTGNVYGYFTVLQYSHTHNNMRYWLCKCKCGNMRTIYGGNLANGKSTSCGCKPYKPYKKKDNCISYTSVYKVYSGMIQRCFNEKCPTYTNYGGRGISVCNEWINDPGEFINWALTNGYEKGLHIDRINNNGNYEPSNCRWTTPKENQNNRRNNVYITFNGETKTLAQWCEIYSIKYDSLATTIRASKADSSTTFKAFLIGHLRRQINKMVNFHQVKKLSTPYLRKRYAA